MTEKYFGGFFLSSFYNFLRDFRKSLDFRFIKYKCFWALLIQTCILFTYHIIFSIRLISIDDFEYKFYFVFYALAIVCFFILGQLVFKNFRMVFSFLFISTYFTFTLASLKYMEFFWKCNSMGRSYKL